MKTIRQISTATIIAVSVLLSGTAMAEDSASQLPAPPAPTLILNMPNFRESYMYQLFAPFRAAVGQGLVLTAEDVERPRQLAAAARRAQALLPFFSADLDGDGQLTLIEYQTAQRRAGRASAIDPTNDPVVKQFQRMDVNGDGIVTFEEAKLAAWHPQDGSSARLYMDDRLGQLLALDPNGDGRLTADELERLGNAAFAFYDRDGDGVLSEDERKVLVADVNENQQVAMLREQFARCVTLLPESNEAVYYIDVSKAQALSSVSLIGQSELTETAEINIEPGVTPLYVLALARTAVIWRFTGDVKRVTHFVMASPVPAAGVTGLPKTAVTLPPRGSCLNSRPSGTASGARLAALAFAQAIGRPLGGVVNQAFFRTQLPSAAITAAGIKDVGVATPPATVSPEPIPAAPPGVDEETNAALWRNHPGGLVQIDPAAVVTASQPESYEVPPMEAGLMQFLADGSISRVGHQTYLINRPIARMPAGLAGPNAVRFSLALGLKPPPGNPRWAPILRPEGAYALPPRINP